jgi:putative transposase
VFVDDADRRFYLGLLRHYSERFGLRIWAYCLMGNHVHLVVVALDPDSMAHAIGAAHRRYARRINARGGWTGHLWGNRFYSTAMDEKHLWSAVRYVETNPVRAGIVHRAEEHPWSSARAHALGQEDPLLASDRPFPGTVEDWSGWLSAGVDEEAAETLRRNTSTGRPSGSVSFRRDIERLLGRKLEPRCRRSPS